MMMANASLSDYSFSLGFSIDLLKRQRDRVYGEYYSRWIACSCFEMVCVFSDRSDQPKIIRPNTACYISILHYIYSLPMK